MIELFPFQAIASAQIANRFGLYSTDPPMRGTEKHLRKVPFYQALQAITGAGKTAILADCVERIHALLPVRPFVLWLSKGRVVVAQTYAGLQPAGKYHHLIDSYDVHLLSEYRPEYALDGGRSHLFFATVGTFNQRDKELGERLIFRSEIDTADLSTWEALKIREDSQGRRRPLLIVYDEAQNLTDQQTALLLELEPDAFIVASATMRNPPRLSEMLNDLKSAGWSDASLVTSVSPGHVALAGLVKSELSISGYQSPMGRTIDEMLSQMEAATIAAISEGLPFRPKAIYVAKTNIVEGNSLQRDNTKRPFLQREAPPIIIWRYLVYEKHVKASEVAVYCSLAFDKDFPPPEEFVLFKGGDDDYDRFIEGNYRHVIFNLSLQEGWDDPTCYFAYVDKSMGSSIQVEQLIGRVLRQPAATRYDSEILNTAHFYVRVDSKNVFAEVIHAVRERIKRDAPEVHVSTYGLGTGNARVEYLPSEPRSVPKIYADPSEALGPIAALIESLPDFRFDAGKNVQGEGYRALIQQRVGMADNAELRWITMERSNPVSARWVFQRAVMRLFPRALEVAGSDEEKFDAKVEIGSRAYRVIEKLADDVVESYFQYVRLRQRAHNPYMVTSVFADPSKVISYENSLHSGYAGLNALETEFALALDTSGLVWCRNPSRTGYGIPLLSAGQTGYFYPDFLVWSDKNVYAIDTTGEHLLREKAARKLLALQASAESVTRLEVRLLSRGRWNDKIEQLSKVGYTLWRLRDDREIGMDHVELMAEAVEKCCRAGQTDART